MSFKENVGFRAEIHKILVRIANREDPDLGLLCLPRPYWQAASVRNLRTCYKGKRLFH